MDGDSLTPPEMAAEPQDENFDEPVRAEPDPEDFLVQLDGYEGPLDVLLDLARRQKVDLRHISVTALVDQYLAFIEEAKKRDLELAADYLVMASWLTFLKSKILLPSPKEDGEEPTADELSARLAFQLQRLDAMRKASEDLHALPQLGVDVFARGQEGLRVETQTSFTADLYDLLKAYTTQRVRSIPVTYHRDPPPVYALEAARERLERLLGEMPDWCLLATVGGGDGRAPARSVVASNFSAALEFAKSGSVELRQSAPFSPIYLRSARKESHQ
ncbi:segregation and condensation protein A [Parvularcula marina]|nr:ScpA family protein [Parvularcula marina]